MVEHESTSKAVQAEGTVEMLDTAPGTGVNRIALARSPEDPKLFVRIVQAAQEAQEEGTPNEAWGVLWHELT